MPVAPRVLSVITRLARGGSERRLYDVLGAVDAEHVVVVGRDSDEGEVRALAERYEVARCDALVRAVDPAADAKALAFLVRTARARRVDVVHTHQSKAGLLGRVAARRGSAPVVYHSASMASWGPGYGRAQSLAFATAERATARLVTRFFVVGNDLAGRLVANGAPVERVEVVRSSLDLSRFVPPGHETRTAARTALGLTAERPVVAYVGSLDDRKNVTMLPGAVADASGSTAPTLLVAGDGPQAGALAAAARAQGDRLDVRCLGHVTDVAMVMHAADVLALPSSAEGLPQVLVQAAACELPFVAFDVDGVHELLALGARGRAVPLGDRAAYVTALARALTVPTARARTDRSTWIPWDPAVVARTYREAYERDLTA